MAQIFSYMLLTGAKTVGFIYPPQEDVFTGTPDKNKNTQSIDDSEDDDDPKINSEEKKKGIKINQHMTIDDDEYFFKSYRFDEIPKEGFKKTEAFQDWIKNAETKFEKFLNEVKI